VSQDGYCFEGLNIFISTVLSVYALMVFKVFLKAFHYPIQLLTVYCFQEDAVAENCELPTRLSELAGTDVFGI
jgi:hypothetical protein